MTATVGVVVVSHNSSDDLPGCLAALGAARAVTRVVVVDNASSDGSCGIVERIADERVELVAVDVNTGFAGGCNRGFAVLGTDVEVVACLNPDVAVESDCLAVAADALRADPDLGGVAPRLMRQDGATVDSIGQVLHPLTLEVRDRGYGRPLSGELLEARPVLAACGALAVYRRRALDAVAGPTGPWCESYFCFWEDLELGWRLTNRGHPICSLPGAVAVHRRGAGARSGRGPLRWRRQVDLEACIITNRWMTLLRHLHALDLAARLPLLLVWDAALTTVGVVRRPSLAAAIARRRRLVADAWRGRGDAPRRRLRELPW